MLTEGINLSPLHTLGSSVLGRAGMGLFSSQGKVSCWSVVWQGLSVGRVWGEGSQRDFHKGSVTLRGEGREEGDRAG